MEWGHQVFAAESIDTHVLQACMGGSGEGFFRFLNGRGGDDTFKTFCSLLPRRFAFYGAYIYGTYPLDMSQYSGLFQSTRIPVRAVRGGAPEGRPTLARAVIHASRSCCHVASPAVRSRVHSAHVAHPRPCVCVNAVLRAATRRRARGLRWEAC